MKRHSLRLALLASLAAFPAVAQEPTGAIGVLIRQAERWLAQDRADLAVAPVERALAADPNNASALSVAARMELARGNREAANAYLARLGQTGATAQAAEVQQAMRAATLDRTALEEARRLSREGRGVAAVQRYRALFGNQPPPDAYALEYYQALAGNPATRPEGIAALTRLGTQPGASARMLLAQAQALTYEQATRAEGIQRLQPLVDVPEVASEARRAWAAAIGFSSNDPGMAPLAEAYARRFPDDAEMRRRAENLRAQAQAALVPATPADPDAIARQTAFERLEAGQVADSGRRFEEILRNNPIDSDALGGLGIIRLREGNPAAARGLLERAMAADPGGGRQWQRALDGAAYGEDLAAARAQFRRGDVDSAELVARRAAQRDVEDRTDAETLLGEIALRRGDAPAAEARFRAALARRPGFPPAQQGLNQSLRAQNRPAEGRVLAGSPGGSAGNLEQPAFAGGTPPTPPAAAGFRSEAARATDPATQAALLRNAMAAAPDDPWVRLDLARSLRRLGRGTEGRALVDELALRLQTPDAIYAAALLAEEDGRAADAENLLARVPPQRRSPDMGRLAIRIRTLREVAAGVAMMAASPIDGRSRLLAIAARPDPTGNVAVGVIRAFAEANDRAGAAEAARVAAIANRGQNSARLAVANALLAAGLEADALAIAADIEAGTPTEETRRDLAALRNGASIRAADRLNEAGDQAGAFERLRPALAAGDNRDAQLALARLYMGARQPTEALRIAEAALARDPRNVDIRRAAVEAAIATGDRARAAQLLYEGQASMPSDARVLLLEARVARDVGDGPRARQALEAALRQRAAELGPGTRGAGAVPVGVNAANPFGRGSGAPAAPQADRLTREIERELAQLRDDVGPSATVATAGACGPAIPGSTGCPKSRCVPRA